MNGHAKKQENITHNQKNNKKKNQSIETGSNERDNTVSRQGPWIAYYKSLKYAQEYKGKHQYAEEINGRYKTCKGHF